MKRIVIILAFTLIATFTAYSQDIAQNNDSLRLRNRNEIQLNDTANSSRAYRNQGKDKFIDLDGDGINDNRCGRGMGLKKGNGQHNCLPGTNARNGSPNGKCPVPRGPKK